MTPVSIALDRHDDLEEWKKWARILWAHEIPPEKVSWQGPDDAPDLLATSFVATCAVCPKLSVPKQFEGMAQAVILHRDPLKWPLLYALFFRLQRREVGAGDRADGISRRLAVMAADVRRDIHKMRAFVRFRARDDKFIAWFEPEHHIVRHNARFFVDRFTDMDWAIFTPEISIHWDRTLLREGPGADRSIAGDSDPIEDIWKSYYSATFNPARLKTKAMLKEMPKRYWHNMPETALITDLIRSAQQREGQMIAAPAREESRQTTLAGLRQEAAGCTRCPLHCNATQTVFGEGPADAKLMIIGEQPGDQEDVAGRPFVGPAGQLLDQALAKAGIDRAQTYLTNAVKHFKYQRRGKIRLHQSPNAGEIQLCRWWVEQEIEIVKPTQIILLGASAVFSLIDKKIPMAEARRASWSVGSTSVSATFHPSYILRAQGSDQSQVLFETMVSDLTKAFEATKPLPAR